MELPIAPDGGVDYDQILGSILERWLTTTIPGKCRFCRKPVPSGDSREKFCSLECRRNWQTVMDAKITIGRRDLKQRGYD